VSLTLEVDRGIFWAGSPIIESDDLAELWHGNLSRGSVAVPTHQDLMPYPVRIWGNHGGFTPTVIWRVWFIVNVTSPVKKLIQSAKRSNFKNARSVSEASD
jgi:hypothetical protein